MPRSRSRHKHHPHHTPAPATGAASHRQKRSAAVILAFLVAIMGAFVAFFIKGPEFLWLAIGAIIGMIAGYLTGHSIDKGIANK